MVGGRGRAGRKSLNIQAPRASVQAGVDAACALRADSGERQLAAVLQGSGGRRPELEGF